MSITKLLKKDLHTYVLATLLALFIVFDIQVPDVVAHLVDNLLGKVVVIISALYLLNFNPLIGSLGVIAAYFLIKRSEINHNILVEKFVPSEYKKDEEMQRYNSVPVTLEETVIKNQIPYSKNRKKIIKSSVKPLDTETRDAASV